MRNSTILIAGRDALGSPEFMQPRIPAAETIRAAGVQIEATEKELHMTMTPLAQDSLVALALLGVVVAGLMMRARRGGDVLFNGGILVSLALGTAFALPLLTHLSWSDLAAEAVEQAVATAELLYACFVILTM